jgi:hypothetical protein
MGLFDGVSDPRQFETSSGLFDRLLSLQKQRDPGADSDFRLTVPQPPLFPPTDWQARGAPQTAELRLAPYSPVPGIGRGENIQDVGITSDQSIYCKTMKDICHRQCVGLALGPDGFGPYRACMRAAGCFDF